MVQRTMSEKSWHRRDPKALTELRRDLVAFPNLHSFEFDDRVEVRGTFPIRGVDGTDLDQFRVRIILPADYPEELPVVREVGGRIPWTEEYHVNPGTGGVACVLIPDDRWKAFPKGARFRRYIEVPLHNFFLGQLCYARGDGWPFGQWGHGNDGIEDYYKHLLKTDDIKVVVRFLACALSAKRWLQELCPCRSGRRVAKCCRSKVGWLKRAIPPKRMLEVFGVLSKRAEA
jgi:hypothetical protein